MKPRKRKREQTDNRGAADVRAMVLAKIARMKKSGSSWRDDESGTLDWFPTFDHKTLDVLARWLKSQTKRTRARKGGL